MDLETFNQFTLQIQIRCDDALSRGGNVERFFTGEIGYRRPGGGRCRRRDHILLSFLAEIGTSGNQHSECTAPSYCLQ